MSKLEQLLAQRLLTVGDELEFTFRNHLFRARLARGGLLHMCTHQASRCASMLPVLPGRTFATLTDYCDTMLQEVLHEYVTRFSAFKRVKHCASGLSMSELRDRLQPLHARAALAPGAEAAQLQQELAAVRAERDALRMQLRAISRFKAPPPAILYDVADCH